MRDKVNLKQKTTLKQHKNQQKGITLIALVVTIVVLLILAGISIKGLTDDNGLIKQANEAKSKTEISQWEEKIDTSVIDTEGKNRNPTIDDIIQGFIDDDIIDSETQVNKETGTIKTNNPSYEIDGKLDDYTGVTAEIIAKADNKENYYGKIVENYECQNGAGVSNWLIFYADENNIYLIADDYIHKDYCPGSENYEITDNGNGYQLEMDDVMKDYPKGSEEITDERLKNLNKNYYDFLKEKGETSTNTNMKFVAYMLDIDVWDVFAGTDAEYAIGGPTIEMFLKSYNEKYKLNNKYQAKTTYKTGYRLSEDFGKTWTNQEVTLNNRDSLYIKYSNASGMYIASPAGAASNYILNAYDGGEGKIRLITSASLGFRPLVCLKSNIRLQKQENGNYIIK